MEQKSRLYASEFVSCFKKLNRHIRDFYVQCAVQIHSFILSPVEAATVIELFDNADEILFNIRSVFGRRLAFVILRKSYYL